MDLFSVIRRPLLSEKSMAMRDAGGKYTFVVDLKATKTDIKHAIEKLLNVNVVSVNTVITRGKYKRRGMYQSKMSSTKKAIVTLSPGQTIKQLDEQ